MFICTGRWEHPTTMAINNIITDAPQCVYDALATTGLVTMHHYFWNYPLLILCPLKVERTMSGYRRLMTSIMEK